MHSLRIQLVYLQSRSLGRCRMIFLTCQRIPEPIDTPISFGHFPYQSPGRVYFIGEHNHLIERSSRRIGRRGIKLQIGWCCKTCLFFSMVHTVNGVKLKLRYLCNFLLGNIVKTNAKILRPRGRNGYCLLRSTSAGDIAHLTENNTVIASL